MFIISPLVPEIENIPISRGCTVDNFVFLFKKKMIMTFSDFISVNFIVFSLAFNVKVNAKLCVFAAIHQRLESDGTERVEGSMTQRLENILNSKHGFVGPT